MTRRAKRANGEGGLSPVKKNGKTIRYRASITIGFVEGKQKRKWVTGKTQNETRARRDELLNKYGTGSKEHISTTMDAWLDIWLAKVRTDGAALNTLRSYTSITRRHIRPRLSDRLLADLKPVDIQAFLQDLFDSGQSQANAHHILTVLKMALRHAVQMEVLDRNPADKVKRPRVEQKEMRCWTRQQAAAFLEVAQGHRLMGLFTLAIFSGMRQGELLGLNWEHVDLEGRIVQVQQSLTEHNGHLILKAPKSRAGRRSIPIAPEAVAALRAHLEAQRAEQAYLLGGWQDPSIVFASEIGTRLDPANVRKVFQALVRRSGVPRIRFHDLRHTHATLLTEWGIHPRTLSDRLGHADPAFTLRVYAHVQASHRREAAISLLDENKLE